jgi:DNA-binding NtrC family response regulator
MFCDLVGDSPAMRELYKMIEKVAPTDATVFLQGESGTGKELVAHAIHQLSPRCQRRYLAVNCGAISPTLIGSELFGHERGSFTGANRQHKGHFERTAGGTLFLDEITEMPTDLQVQLLRVLETGKLLRLGGDHEVPVDVRVIAATNRSPEEVVAEGKLRKDLYFRLMVFPLYIPPLREREGDVTLLAQYFLGLLNHQYSLEKHFTKAVLQSLEERPWQGNVRELRNAIQRAFILADREIGADHFATGDLSEEEQEEEDPLNLSVGTSIDDAEKRLIFATLEHYGGDKTRTAEALGISLKTLYNRLKKYEVDWDH